MEEWITAFKLADSKSKHTVRFLFPLHIHTHTNTCMHTCTHSPTHPPTHTHTHTPTHTHTHTQAILEAIQHLEGQHSWFACSHPRPTYCNVCREQLHGVAWHGLSCEVCKIKSHRRCVFSVKTPCKWTTRASLAAAGVHSEQDVSVCRSAVLCVLTFYDHSEGVLKVGKTREC